MPLGRVRHMKQVLIWSTLPEIALDELTIDIKVVSNT